MPDTVLPDYNPAREDGTIVGTQDFDAGTCVLRRQPDAAQGVEVGG